MLKNLFKKRNQKSVDEIRLEEYKKSLMNITEHFNGVRINETLVGRIKGERMLEADCIVVESDKPKFPTKSSTPRPKSYGNNLFAWIEEIRQDAKDVVNKNRQHEIAEKEYQEKIKTERNEVALKERREFFIGYGLLPKQTV